MMFQQLTTLMNVNMGIARPWFSITSQILLFLGPIITMRLLAEERGTGRIDLLLSAPITDLQLGLSKFLAGVALCLLLLLPTHVYPPVLFSCGNPEPGPILAGYLGLLLLTQGFMAVVLAVSGVAVGREGSGVCDPRGSGRRGAGGAAAGRGGEGGEGWGGQGGGAGARAKDLRKLPGYLAGGCSSTLCAQPATTAASTSPS